MQPSDIQFNTYYYIIYNNNPTRWFINTYYRRDSSGFVGKCINAYDSFYIIDNIGLNNGDIESITTCIKITNPNTVYETHPHLFV